ncbi:AI-2E family transporter [Microbacterium sp.]|uniref:AI-2E family transporter n=1 Tax=Microbacterium sp. TaxID=51671 RepID=UPI00289837FA|nr:AI-2E family transporter [Microbacterium sp.]
MLTSSSDSAGRQRRAHVDILVTLACIVVALIGLHLARAAFAPLAVAAVIVIVCLPLRDAVLTRTRTRPVWLGTATIILVAFGVIAATGALIWIAMRQLVQLLEDLAPGGMLEHVALSIDDWISFLPGVSPEPTGTRSFDLTAVLIAAREVGGSLISIAVALFFVCAYVVVVAADTGRWRHAEQLLGPSAARQIGRIGNLNSSIRRYYVVNSVFGGIVAVIDGLALWALGVPAPVVWAVLAFVTNFIPTVGFIVGLVPPALLALATGGWPLFIAVIAIYSLVNVTLQVLIQPKFVSDAVGLSLTLSFFSVFFWAFVLGPIGTILAIPLTLVARAMLLEGKPQTAWSLWLLGKGTVNADAPRPRFRTRKMPWKQRGYRRSG